MPRSGLNCGTHCHIFDEDTLGGAEPWKRVSDQEFVGFRAHDLERADCLTRSILNLRNQWRSPRLKPCHQCREWVQITLKPSKTAATHLAAQHTLKSANTSEFNSK